MLTPRHVVADDLQQRFAARFGGEPRVYRAPGRVNLIGEHTDYNDGFVMPAAIDLSTWVAIGPRADRRLVVHSENRGASHAIDLTNGPPRPGRRWSDYVFGVAAELMAAGVDLPGANILVSSEVPSGAGLSSSAALEVSVGYALLHTIGAPIDRLTLALVCQRAENQFVGARCGIMDQFVATHGSAGHVLMLDCRSLDFRALPLPAEGRLVICNTMVKHSVAAGAYNTRRRECEEAVRKLAASVPAIRALRDVSPETLNRWGTVLPAAHLKRARHVVEENRRVIDAAAALDQHDLPAFGALMAASHRSLRDDFDVSCRELDLMVDLAVSRPGVYGARMTGGGFGGCTINLVHATQTDAFVETITTQYRERTAMTPDVYVCSAADAVAAVS